MNGFGFDPDVPSGFQDADIEMRELEQAAHRMAESERKGICAHGRVKFSEDTVRCHDCDRVWDSVDAFYDSDPKFQTPNPNAGIAPNQIPKR